MTTSDPKAKVRTERIGITGLPAYALICAGQLVSMTGSGLSGFVLGVWIYQETGSMTKFGLALFCTTLPTILILPIAGVIADRLDRRRQMIFSDSLASLVSLALASLLFAGALELWHVYASIVTLSAVNAFRYLSFTAAITVLVDRKQYGLGIGMMQFAEAASLIIAPGLAGVLIATVPLSKIMLIDFSTFIFSLATLLMVRIPRVARPEENLRLRSFVAELTFGWNYIAGRPGLLGLMILFLLTNFNTGIWEALLSPLLLRLSTPSVLGSVLSIRSVGILVATLIISSLRSIERRILVVIVFSLLQGVSLILGGIHITSVAIAGAAILISFSFPIINNCSQHIWQSKVAPELQGRVFATRRMFTLIGVPVAYVLAGGLADHIFEPSMREGGKLAGSVGRIIGVGPNHGIALLFIILGVIMIVEVIACAMHPRIRGLENELPDAVRPEAAVEPEDDELPEAALIAEQVTRSRKSITRAEKVEIKLRA